MLQYVLWKRNSVSLLPPFVSPEVATGDDLAEAAWTIMRACACFLVETPADSHFHLVCVLWALWIDVIKWFAGGIGLGS
jgi:hypothetical protein